MHGTGQFDYWKYILINYKKVQSTSKIIRIYFITNCIPYGILHILLWYCSILRIYLFICFCKNILCGYFKNTWLSFCIECLFCTFDKYIYNLNIQVLLLNTRHYFVVEVYSKYYCYYRNTCLILAHFDVHVIGNSYIHTNSYIQNLFWTTNNIHLLLLSLR